MFSVALLGHSEGSLLVFSDVDDTIKVSYVRSKKEMISYSVFNDSLFYGMNDVYRGIAESFRPDQAADQVKFHYVSNGWKPTVQETHSALLVDYGFPDSKNYYNRRLKEILKIKLEWKQSLSKTGKTVIYKHPSYEEVISVKQARIFQKENLGNIH